jgi:hypothetical protein
MAGLNAGNAVFAGEEANIIDHLGHADTVDNSRDVGIESEVG